MTPRWLRRRTVDRTDMSTTVRNDHDTAELRGSAVVHMSSAHQPFDVRIFQKECRSLAEAGYAVSYIGPGEASGTYSGIRVIGLTPAGSRAARVAFGLPKLLRAALRERAACYHLHDPELLTLAIPLRLAGAHVIYDAHEDLPLQVRNKPYIPTPLQPVVAAASAVYLRIFTRFVDHVVAATPDVARRFTARRPTTVVRNYPRLEMFTDGSESSAERQRNALVYIGGVTRTRGAVEMLQAIDLVPDELAPRLILAGPIEDESLRAELEGMPAWTATTYCGVLPHDEVRQLLRTVGVGLATLHPTSSYRESYPVKLFEYMAAGLPVIASDFPMWREFVGSPPGGLLVDPMRPAEISAAITTLLRDPGRSAAMGIAGQQRAVEKYSWANEARRLVDAYQQVVKTRGIREAADDGR